MNEELEQSVYKVRDLRDQIAEKVGELLEELTCLGDHITVEEALFRWHILTGHIDEVSNTYLVGIGDGLEGGLDTLMELEERYGGDR